MVFGFIPMKPCPFCGGSELDYQTQTPDREGVPTNVICQDCGACGPWVYEKAGEVAQANEQWNIRSYFEL